MRRACQPESYIVKQIKFHSKYREIRHEQKSLPFSGAIFVTSRCYGRLAGSCYTGLRDTEAFEGTPTPLPSGQPLQALLMRVQNVWLFYQLLIHDLAS